MGDDERDDTRDTVGNMQRDAHDEAGKRGAEAWQRLKENRNWRDWLTVGDALQIGREWAMSEAQTNRPVGSAYNRIFGEWLERYGLHEMDKGDRSRLFTVMENLPEIEKWRHTLTLNEQLRLNHPNGVLRRWQAKTRVPDPNKPKRPGLKESVADLDEEVALLKSRLADRDKQIEALQAAQPTTATTPALAEALLIRLADTEQSEAEAIAARLWTGLGIMRLRPQGAAPTGGEPVQPTVAPSLAKITAQWVTCLRAAAADTDETKAAMNSVSMALVEKEWESKEQQRQQRNERRREARGKQQPPQQIVGYQVGYQIVKEPPTEPVTIEGRRELPDDE
jgi:hypothetical protein